MYLLNIYFVLFFSHNNSLERTNVCLVSVITLFSSSMCGKELNGKTPNSAKKKMATLQTNNASELCFIFQKVTL